MSKTIAFFVRNVDATKEPFSDREYYYYSYQHYLLAFKRAGAEAFFVSGPETYLGKGRFARAWSIDQLSEVKDFAKIGEIRADLVFEKGGFREYDVPTVTDIRLYPLLTNKAATYAQFSRYQPMSIVCENEEQLKAAVRQLPGETVVVKSPVGNGGKRVYINTKDRLRVPKDETYPLIAQEFIDMSEGVPELASGIHDIRILMTGSKLIGGTLRQPAQGKMHANVSQGGSERFLSVGEIPAEVRELAQEIDSQIEDMPRFYAIDFAKGKQGWMMVELNARPGLNTRKDAGPLAIDFMNQVADYMVSLP